MESCSIKFMKIESDGKSTVVAMTVTKSATKGARSDSFTFSNSMDVKAQTRENKRLCFLYFFVCVSKNFDNWGKCTIHKYT